MPTNGGSRFASCVGLLLAVCAACSGPTAAAEGSWALDPSYGDGGALKLTFPEPISRRDRTPSASAMFVQGKNDVLVVPNYGTGPGPMFRLGPDGEPIDAPVVMPSLDGGSTQGAQIDSQGRLVTAVRQNFVAGIARLGLDGGLDGTFNTGGVFLTPRDMLSMTVDSQDRVLVGTALIKSEKTIINGQVTRLLPSGIPDPSFGSGGTVETGDQIPACMTVDARSRVLVGDQRGKLLALNDDGSVDNSYGVAGVAKIGERLQTGKLPGCFGLPNGAAVVTTRPVRSAGGVVLLDENGRVAARRRLEWSAWSARVLPDSEIVLVAGGSIGVLPGPEEGDGYTATVQAFDGHLSPLHRYGGAASVHVDQTMRNVAGTAIVLPDGNVLSDIESSSNSETLARINLGVAQRSVQPPAGTGSPHLLLKALTSEAGLRGVQGVPGRATARVSFRCAPHCGVAAISYTYREATGRRRVVFRSAKMPLAASGTAALGSGSYYDTRTDELPDFVAGRRYRLSVSATDAYGRVVRLDRAFLVRPRR